MEAFISYKGFDNVLFSEGLNVELEDLVDGFDKLVPLPIISDIEIRRLSMNDYNSHFKAVSTIAYCLKTPNDILIVTHEFNWNNNGSDLICIRDSRGLKECIMYCDDYPKELKEAYEYHCGLLAQSAIKSAKSA